MCSCVFRIYHVILMRAVFLFPDSLSDTERTVLSKKGYGYQSLRGGDVTEIDDKTIAGIYTSWIYITMIHCSSDSLHVVGQNRITYSLQSSYVKS